MTSKEEGNVWGFESNGGTGSYTVGPTRSTQKVEKTDNERRQTEKGREEGSDRDKKGIKRFLGDLYLGNK